MSQAESLLAPFHFDAVIADKGYDSDPLRELLAAQQVEVVIPFRRYRKQPRAYDRIRYRERNIVERFINKIKWYRRIFTRYDKLARRFMAFLHFASALIWLKRNVNEPNNRPAAASPAAASPSGDESMNEDRRIDAAELDKELDAALVSFKQGTRRYIEGHVAINQANRLFGYDG